MQEFTALLEEDRGLALWQAYSAFSGELVNYENQMKKEAQRTIPGGGKWEHSRADHFRFGRNPFIVSDLLQDT